MLRLLPNLITALRMAGSVCLLFIQPLSATFYVIYTLCGISDALDGLAARATKNTSEFGAKLDSISDLFFYAVMLLRIFPILWDRLPAGIWYAAGFVLLLRLCTYVTAALKYRRFASLHTYLNKLTGLSVFLIPYLIGQSCAAVFCIAVCTIAGIAAAEELLIHLRTTVYNPEIKTLIHLRGRHS